MVSIECKIGATRLMVTEKELSIAIPRNYFSQKVWQDLEELAVEIASIGLGWVVGPSTIAPVASTVGNGPPRWRRMSLDVLSYLLFVLLIPAGHPLRKLYEAYDWHKIDEKCASVYRNQKRGAPAYPPQVMFRILVLMFYSGTPFESTTLSRLRTDVSWR